MNSDLVQYIKQSLRAGYSASSIRTVLLNEGYSAQEVTDTIAYVVDEQSVNSQTQSTNNSRKGLLVVLAVLLVVGAGVSVFFFIGGSSQLISDEAFTQGTTIQLQQDTHTQFSIAEEVHTLRVDEVTDEMVSITIMSDPIRADIGLGEEEKFDVTGDEFFDIRVRLDGVSDEVPDLFVQRISERICTEDWSCDDWGACSSDGEQVRSCSDVNGCGTELAKPSTTRSCSYEEPTVNSTDIEVDVILEKTEYEVGEKVSGEYHLSYQGVPFEGAVVYCKRTGCSKTTGTLEDINFSNPEKTNNLNVELKDTVYSAGTHNFSVYVYDCQDIDEVFKTDDCGSGGWPPTIEIEDIVSSVSPLQSRSKSFTVEEVEDGYVPECTTNDDCSQSCANCDEGTLVCAQSSNPSIHQTCVECINDFGCVEGYTCQDNVCVVEEQEVVDEETEPYPVTNPDSVQDCYNEDFSESLCSAEDSLAFTDLFETRLSSCESSQGTFALGFEPAMGLLRGYEIQEEQADVCVIRFWFLENAVVDNSLLGKDMVCEYNSSQQTLEEVATCLEDCCTGELVDALNNI